jgi:hypothetical protein
MAKVEFKTKSGFRGDMLIGYSGRCIKCGQERRLYFARVRDDIRRKMITSLNRAIMIHKGLCEVCAVNGLIYSVQEWLLMNRQQVDKDLAILNGGMLNINFDKADRDARENLKNDKWLDDNEKHVESWKKFKGKQ